MDISTWQIPQETRILRLGEEEIKIPYIIKDRVLLKEGIANGLFYPGKEIEPTVEVLNSKPDPNDVEARKRTSIFWDHDDACKNWLGEIKNFHWDPETKELQGEVYLVDEDAAKKTHYQLKENFSRWGISPRLRVNDEKAKKDKIASNIEFVSFALVLEPAGGPKLMLAQKHDIEEEFYEDLELEKGSGELRFDLDNLTSAGLSKLAEEFSLSPEELAQFSEEQLGFLREVPSLALEENQEKFDCECIECDYKLTSDKHCDTLKCPECGGQMRRAERPGPGQPSPDSLRKQFKTFAPLIKINQDEHIVKLIVLEPEVVDNQGHIVSEEEIRKGMYLYMEHYRNLEVMHRDKAGNLFPLEEKVLGPDDKSWKQGWDEDFAILEAFQAPADYFENEEIVRKGSWIMTLRIKNEDIWDKIKNKELTGASIGGHSFLGDIAE